MEDIHYSNRIPTALCNFSGAAHEQSLDTILNKSWRRPPMIPVPISLCTGLASGNGDRCSICPHAAHCSDQSRFCICILGVWPKTRTTLSRRITRLTIRTGEFPFRWGSWGVSHFRANSITSRIGGRTPIRSGVWSGSRKKEFSALRSPRSLSGEKFWG